ncbi:MAG: hypothetical protein GXP53_06940 [Deltaproteobacteria bacterium]|nr:hypothetical protein [Deltaproteobacteria bacterium]
MGEKHWEKRPEANWEKFQFNQPYAKGLKRLKEDVLEKTNFDPATLWQWGTMQAMAVIEILKSVEKKFGKEGQALILQCLRKIGYDIGKQVTDGTLIPEDMPDEEWVSFYATIMNRIAYASLESPEIIEKNKADFHIDWCPHQDTYEAMDCRVQRYFVQGMIDAATDYCKSQGREFVWDIWFRSTIPSGSQTCHFEMQQGDTEDTRQWAEYTQLMEERALKIAKADRV